MKTHCEFRLRRLNLDNTAEYECTTHGMTGIRPDSTVTEFGAYTLCPVGKIEFAVERGLERIEAALKASNKGK